MTTEIFPTDQPYVCGFAFGPAAKHVLLMRKKRPYWQMGNYNGIGGKINEGELPLEAMIREAREEVGFGGLPGLLTWDHFLTLRGPRLTKQPAWVVYFFRMFLTNMTDIHDAIRHAGHSKEQVMAFDVENMPSKRLDNLDWIVPLALDEHLVTPIIMDDTVFYG